MIAHPADRERLFDALNKETMLKNLRERGSFSLTYQLMLGRGNSYTRMSVFWANDKKHLIMGVKSIDNEMQRENEMKKMVAENAVFSQIAESLASLNMKDEQYPDIFFDLTIFSSIGKDDKVKDMAFIARKSQVNFGELYR